MEKKDATYPVDDYPKISVSTDMGWQQKGSGRAHSSTSGHEGLCAVLTRKFVDKAVKVKFCRICRLHGAKKAKVGESEEAAPVKPHDCTVNHVGSSGAMESAAAVEMIHNLYDTFHVKIQNIITDDDSSMQSHCRYSNDDHERAYGERPMIETSRGLEERKDLGLLRYPIPELKFLGDPAHRKKLFRNRLYTYFQLGVKKNHGFREADLLRLVTNFSYMSRQLPHMERSKWGDAAKATVEHHFDNHNYCGDFCKRGKELAANAEAVLSNKIYRSKTVDKELYPAICDILQDFITKERLEQIGHGYDTNANESFNNTASWFAPKNKVYSGSCSLRNRICMAIGINILGFNLYFRRLLKKLGIEVDPATDYYLQQQDNVRKDKKKRETTLKFRLHRNQKKFDNLREKTLTLARALLRKQGVYQTGVAMEKEKLTQGSSTATVKKRPQKEEDNGACVCASCGEPGHKRSTNRDCRNNKKSAAQAIVSELEAQQEMMAEEQSILDTLLVDGSSIESQYLAEEILDAVNEEMEDEEEELNEEES